MLHHRREDDSSYASFMLLDARRRNAALRMPKDLTRRRPTKVSPSAKIDFWMASDWVLQADNGNRRRHARISFLPFTW